MAIAASAGYGSFELALMFLAVGGVALVYLVVRALIRVGDKRPPPIVMAAPVATAPPPGWYPDHTGTLRWFDGRQWTEFIQPAAGGSPNPPEPR
ncbi:DUF2510 domain-containing protein [Nocardia otitidiscaviarum]|uniref:DUF2510 domain-containing protein n=1 Tax=Nocardia otitidiscaviarum TaxID=1823 RepID=UPI0011DDDA47|nr:DUF2510 domain-containing protein [Nocardia otitidiscaviarum]MBF6136630.1 DUF2510 domain-containing protein [Nocardia otitidiscaviarum]MBF6484832.1 DUF2510 domain-containing protein [Nocardia otitidiscaviarum]